MGIPRVSSRPIGEPQVLIWLGEPSRAGYRDVPLDWRACLKAVSIVLGIDLLIVESPAELTSKGFEQKADGLLIPRGTEVAKWRITTDPEDHIVIGAPGSGFEALLAAVRSKLIETCQVAAAVSVPGRRQLGPGERVYHRKVGSSAATDVFDAGSPEPCAHGEGCYERWTKAPKALKGMQRRYIDVTERNLYHCDKYPNCGMYMICGE